MRRFRLWLAYQLLPRGTVVDKRVTSTSFTNGTNLTTTSTFDDVSVFYATTNDGIFRYDGTTFVKE